MRMGVMTRCLEGMDRVGGIVKGREESSEPATARGSYFDRR